MKLRILITCGLAACVVWLVWSRTSPQPLASSSTVPPTPQARTAMELWPKKTEPPSPNRPKRRPAPRGEAALETIRAAAGSHDAEKVPLLARYLESDAADVRAAALQGLIDMGDRDAIPYLKIAAEETKLPEEKTELIKAIEFLSLPTWKEHRDALKAAAEPRP